MSNFGHDIAEKLLKYITTAVSKFALIILFCFLQHMLDMSFVCSCVQGFHLNGWLYLVAPPAILTLVYIIFEHFHWKKNTSDYSLYCSICSKICCSIYSKISRSWSRCCKNCCKNCCSFFFNLVITFAGLVALWVSAVLFDGDWYLCLMTNMNASQTGIPCRANLSYDEQRIRDAHKTMSLDIGFTVIFFSLCLWSIVEISRSYCKSGECCPPHYRVVYKELLSKQVSSHLTIEMENIAKTRAEAICEPHLEIIKNKELNVNEPQEGVSEAWEEISSLDFYLIENRQTEQRPPR
ncbi:uncharacterized protein LOC115062128 [Echeneis naucrates]|uniref:uncharacterized protein LOC115062128 n=1 Tax=Echeneis naucrates TaxID=173247 RepID=UPI0011140AF4|nr:uncharacterized protein LOC115062128 [Echeneis naucrates]